ncbi:MAG: tyrosine-type recombinase/integrase, partial [Desertimonas sp.]
MAVTVTRVDGTHQLDGGSGVVGIGNRWLVHLEARNRSPATVRGYALDLVSLGRFLEHARIDWTELVPADVFDWLEWQARPVSSARERVVAIGKAHGAAPSTMNRRVAAVRGLFEYAVMCRLVGRNPVPAPRRSSGLRARRSGLLGHTAGRRTPGPARLVRQDRPSPETVDASDIEVFLADLNTHRDRAITSAMLLGGLRASEVASSSLTPARTRRPRDQYHSVGSRMPLTTSARSWRACWPRTTISSSVTPRTGWSPIWRRPGRA